jgi:SecD/SecF fusion protein
MISLFAQVAPPAAPAVPWYQESWFGVFIALAVVILPFLAGHWIAKKLRMIDYGWRIGLILFSLTAGIVICITGWPPKRGIDLSGGVILVYEVDQSKASTVDVPGTVDQLRKDFSTLSVATEIAPTDEPGKLEITLPGTDPAQTVEVETALSKANIPDTLLIVEARPIRDGRQVLAVGVRSTRAIDMDRMISAISKRVNPGGQLEVTIRRMGNDRVEVIIPQAEPAEVDIVKDKISTAGALQFRILANPNAPDHQPIIELAKQTEGREVKQKNSEGHDETVAEWIPVDPQEFSDPRRSAGFVTRPSKKGELEALAMRTPYDVTGADLARASAGHDEFGRPDVVFSFNSRGASLFGELTGSHLPDPNGNLKYDLGIVLDGVLKSSAYIKSTITTTGTITSDRFTEQDVQTLVDILNAGSLPAALAKVPVSEYSASAQLGNDTIRAGAFSMIVATVAILIFMQIYYGFSGLIANLAVLMNLVLVLALMILIKAHLTLAGLAGLVLSVGMAVDANVLIYERMREEQERGAALRMAIRNGFGRAMATIIDSHCTTLITGIVLFVIGTDQLRGFATTLVLGLLLNLFTAVYCSRIVFDIAERKRILKHLNMMRIFGKTNFDFVKWMPRWMAISVTAIVIGMGGAVAREMGWFGGAGLFGIDFTGGTAVQVVFKEPIDISEVRKAVDQEKDKLPDAAVSAVASTEGQLPNTRFNIDTSYHGEKAANEATGAAASQSSEAIKEVEKELTTIFAGKLKTYSMEVASVEPEKPATNEISAEKPTNEKSAAEKSTEKGAGQKSAADKTAEEKPAAAPTGTVATLKFPDAITYAALELRLNYAQKANSLPQTTFDISSTDPEYTPGSGIAVQKWTVRSSLNKEQTETLLSSVQQQLAETPVFPTASNIGGKVAGDTETTAYYALFVSNVLVALYIWIRFQNLIFGLAAIVALIHDVFIAVGALALSYWLAGPLGFLQIDPFKISLEVVAALLTIVGYSINDTIVVFDRIREIRGKSPELTATMINQAVNQTLSRTILTSTTVFLVTFILFFAGGEGVHAFSFAMMIGVLTGTYSSVFIAAPILLWFKRPAGTPSGDRKASLEALRPTRAA